MSSDDEKKRHTDRVLVEAVLPQSTWLGYLWDTVDLPSKERRLLFKVDAVLLTFASLGYFIKNLDQTNVTNAYLSGMKESLGLYGNELVTATTIWTVGYVVGQIPINLLLTRISPRWIIPGIELFWGISTLAMYAVKDVKALYALRFLVGLFESGFYPACTYMLGSWYSPRELAKRQTIFWAAGSLGQMFSGFLQAAAYKNLSGVSGLAGWQWLFIVDGIITIPIALLGFVFLPGVPWNSNTFWLSETEIELANARMQRVGRQSAQPWTRQKIKNLFSSWHIYLLPVAYMLYNNSVAQTIVGYWLKSYNAKPAPVLGKTFTVSQINLYPLPGIALFIIAALFYAWTSDGILKGRRWVWPLFGTTLNIIVNAVLVSTPLYSHFGRRLTFYYLTTMSGAWGALILVWISEITGHDNEARAIIVAASNDLAYVMQAIAPNFVWKTTEFPRARKGHLFVIALSAISIPWITMIYFLVRRDERRVSLSIRQDSINSLESESSSDVKDKSDVLLEDPSEALVVKYV